MIIIKIINTKENLLNCGLCHIIKSKENQKKDKDQDHSK